MKDFLKLFKILLIFYLICHILYKLKNIEGFVGETCQNECVNLDQESCNSRDEECIWTPAETDTGTDASGSGSDLATDAGATGSNGKCSSRFELSDPIWEPERTESDTNIIYNGELTCPGPTEGPGSFELKSVDNPTCDEPVGQTLTLHPNIQNDPDDHTKCVIGTKCIADIGDPVAAAESGNAVQTAMQKTLQGKLPGEDPDAGVITDCAGTCVAPAILTAADDAALLTAWNNALVTLEGQATDAERTLSKYDCESLNPPGTWRIPEECNIQDRQEYFEIKKACAMKESSQCSSAFNCKLSQSVPTAVCNTCSVSSHNSKSECEAAEEVWSPAEEGAINCPTGCTSYPGGHEKQWEQIRYGRDDITSIINTKPMCILRDINETLKDVNIKNDFDPRALDGEWGGIGDPKWSGIDPLSSLETIKNLCSNITGNELNTKDVCEGIKVSDENDGGFSDPMKAAIQQKRSQHCVWIPPTGGDATELNTYECVDNVDTSSIQDATYTPKKCSPVGECLAGTDLNVVSGRMSTREDNCINQPGCIYKVEDTCFSNTNTANFECPEKKYIPKSPPIGGGNFVPFIPSASDLDRDALYQEKLIACCEAREGYCKNNADHTKDIICPSGQVVQDPDNDMVLMGEDPVTRCCKDPTSLDTQISIKLDGLYTTVNLDRANFETDFKTDLIKILRDNNIINKTTGGQYTTDDITIIDISDGSINVRFELKEALNIKPNITSLLETKILFPSLNMSTIPIVTMDETTETDVENTTFGIENKYLYIGGGITLCISLLSSFLMLLMVAL